MEGVGYPDGVGGGASRCVTGDHTRRYVLTRVMRAKKRRMRRISKRRAHQTKKSAGASFFEGHVSRISAKGHDSSHSDGEQRKLCDWLTIRDETHHRQPSARRTQPEEIRASHHHVFCCNDDLSPTQTTAKDGETTHSTTATKTLLIARPIRPSCRTSRGRSATFAGSASR